MARLSHDDGSPTPPAIMKHDFRIVQRCPVPKDIAPYIAIITKGSRVNSIYRGDDARALLNKYGKHSQTQIYYATPAERQAWDILGHPNPPHRSTHEQYSDGVAYPHTRMGDQLAFWQVGFDVQDADVDRVIAVAAKYHWQVFRPYPSGVEHHHLNFRVQPKPHSAAAGLLVAKTALTLPRS